MLPNSIQLPGLQSTREAGRAPEPTAEDEDQKLMQKSREFEAVFIGQMLTFSGLDKALTMGGGSDASAFTGMYIQQFAEQIADKGGFGLAEKIYTQMSRLSGATDTLKNEGDINVNADKL